MDNRVFIKSDTTETLSLIDNGNRFVMIENSSVSGLITRYQHPNHQGSCCLETDENGDVITYEEYHPFGTTSYQATNGTITAAAKRYRYTGMERDDETGLSYHNARYYIPWLGRWLNCDPIGIGDGVNVYAYCGNEPVKNTDKKGTQTKQKETPQKEGFWAGFGDELLKGLLKGIKHIMNNPNYDGNFATKSDKPLTPQELKAYDMDFSKLLDPKTHIEGVVEGIFSTIEFGKAIYNKDGRVAAKNLPGTIATVAIAFSSSKMIRTPSVNSLSIRTGMTLAEKIEIRKLFAREFLKKSGVTDIDRHLEAIHFESPVSIKNLNKGDEVFRYTEIGTDKPKHYYFTNVDVAPGQIGKMTSMYKDPSKWIMEKFTLEKPVEGLTSTIDLAGDKGAIQIFSTEIEAASKVEIIKRY